MITARDVAIIYEVPIAFHEQGLDERIVEYLNIWTKAPDLSDWERIVKRVKEPAGGDDHRHRRQVRRSDRELQIPLRGADPWRHRQQLPGQPQVCRFRGAGAARDRRHLRRCRRHPRSRRLRRARQRREDRRDPSMPGSIRSRSSASVSACRWRWSSSPATSAASRTPTRPSFTEEAKNPVIHIMEKPKGREGEGRDDAPRRLSLRPGQTDRWPGASTARRRSASAIAIATNSTTPTAQKLQRCGLVISGVYPEGDLVEIVEIADHPWFLGCQFHPEFRSRPMAAAPAVRIVRRRLPEGAQGDKYDGARSCRRQCHLRRRSAAGADRRTVRDRGGRAHPAHRRVSQETHCASSESAWSSRPPMTRPTAPRRLPFAVRGWRRGCGFCARVKSGVRSAGRLRCP